MTEKSKLPFKFLFKYNVVFSFTLWVKYYIYWLMWLFVVAVCHTYFVKIEKRESTAFGAIPCLETLCG